MSTNSEELARHIERLRSEALLSLLDSTMDMDRFRRIVESAFGVETRQVIEVNRRSGFYPPLRRPAKGSELDRHWSEMLRDEALAQLEAQDPLIFCLELSRRMDD